MLTVSLIKPTEAYTGAKLMRAECPVELRINLLNNNADTNTENLVNTVGGGGVGAPSLVLIGVSILWRRTRKRMQ